MNSHSLRRQTAQYARRTPGRKMRARYVAIGAYLLLAAITIVLIGFFAHSAAYFPVDLTVTRAVQSFNPPWFDFIMRNVNWLGFGLQATSLVIVVILISFLAGWRWEAIVAAIDAGSIWAINIIIGFIVARPYPAAGPEFNGMLVDLTRPSFPGGHASSFIAFYGFMFYLVYTRVTERWLRYPLLVIFGALPILVVPSRVYMGRHWPSDTVAAVALGTTWLVLAIYLYQWGKGQEWVRKHLKDTKPVWSHSAFGGA